MKGLVIKLNPSSYCNSTKVPMFKRLGMIFNHTRFHQNLATKQIMTAAHLNKGYDKVKG